MPVRSRNGTELKIAQMIPFTDIISSENNTYDLVCLIHYRITVRQKSTTFPGLQVNKNKIKTHNFMEITF